MKTIFIAALTVGALTAPAAMAEVSNNEAKQIVQQLIEKQPAYGAQVGQVQRQGSYIVVRTLTPEGMPYRSLKVDPESGRILGVPSQPMMGKSDSGTNG